MRIISVRENPRYQEEAVRYIHGKWGNEKNFPLYADCIGHSISTPNPLPRWYLLEDKAKIIGCGGLITNDFISRMDLWPWICSLYIEADCRGRAYGSVLLRHIRREARTAGFAKVYLYTDHSGYYEKYGFSYIGQGYHPWGESSRIYAADSAE